MRYIVVFHTWFVDTKWFDVIEFDTQDKKEVEKECKALKYDKEDTFHNVAFEIIEIDDRETLSKLNKIPMWIRKLYKAV